MARDRKFLAWWTRCSICTSSSTTTRHTRQSRCTASFKLHFIPISSSWLNLVERFFALITEDAIRRGVFKSMAELEAAIAAYLTNHNATSKPFVWTKSADVILRKVGRARATLTAIKNGNQASESVH